MNYEKKYKDLLEKARQDSYFITPEESLGISSDEYNEIVDECIFGEMMGNDGKISSIDGFDAELNALLKKYEHLPKEEIAECLSFYLGVVQGEQKPKCTEEQKIAQWPHRCADPKMPCLNPLHDCVDCPRQFGDWNYTTSTDLKEEQK